MKLTTVLSALALAGMFGTGAMAQAPREVTAIGSGSVEYRASYAHATYILHLEDASTLPALEPQFDALIGSANSLVKRRIYPTIIEEHTSWLQNLFIDWDDEERYSTAFAIQVEGTETDLLTFEQGLAEIGEIHRKNYHSFRLPEGLDIQSQAIRDAETNSRLNADRIANAFGCNVSDLVQIEISNARSGDFEGLILRMGGLGPETDEADPFETEVEMSVTATYETICPAAD